MIRPLSLLILAAVGLSPALHAQDKNVPPPPIKIRAVLHDPVHPVAELFYPDKSGALLPLDFRPQDLTETLLMQPVNGWLVLYDKATIDPKKPEESLAGCVKLPPDFQQGMLLVMPAQHGEKPAYRMMLIDDTMKAFPGGESMAISLVGAEMAIEAGEHKVLVHPGKIVRVPPVKKVNDFNMAQTNFYYQQNGSWVAFTERQLQYLDACRRLFIIHATPGALQPTVTTIVDVMRSMPLQ